MKLPKGVTIERVEVVFSQPEDSDEHPDADFQTLIVKMCDAGGGPYLAIETERWAIDEPKEFAALLAQVLALTGTKEKP